MKVIRCFVNGKWREYKVKDWGTPVTRFGTGGEYTKGGLEVHRIDPPWNKGGGYVGNFHCMDDIMGFIHCLRAGHVTIREVQEELVPA